MEPKFLVIDDEQSACDILCALLGSLGCQSEYQVNPTEALTMLHDNGRAKEFDGIFLDIMMPSLSGYSVLKSLRENPATAELPVIAVTCLDGREELISGYNAGFDYYITKPFSKEQLVYGLDLLFSDGEEKPDEKVHVTKYEV